METYVELIQRLLEIQSGGRPRSPELVAKDERLMDGLQKRNLAGRSLQPKRPGPARVQRSSSPAALLVSTPGTEGRPSREVQH